MSELVGPRNIAKTTPERIGDPQRSIGNSLQNKVDQEIDRILDEQYNRGMKLLTENKSVLDAIAARLIEKEKMEGSELLGLIQSLKPSLLEGSARPAQVLQPAFFYKEEAEEGD